MVTRKTGEARGMAFAVLNLADVASRQGHAVEAEERYDEAIATFRGVGDLFGVAIALGRGATISLRQEEHAAAEERHREALAIYRQFGDRRGVARTLMHLGDVAQVAGDRTRAVDFYEESLSERKAPAIGWAPRRCSAGWRRWLPTKTRIVQRDWWAPPKPLRAVIGASLTAQDAADQAEAARTPGPGVGPRNPDGRADGRPYLTARIGAGRLIPLLDLDDHIGQPGHVPRDAPPRLPAGSAPRPGRTPSPWLRQTSSAGTTRRTCPWTSGRGRGPVRRPRR